MVTYPSTLKCSGRPCPSLRHSPRDIYSGGHTPRSRTSCRCALRSPRIASQQQTRPILLATRATSAGAHERVCFPSEYSLLAYLVATRGWYLLLPMLDRRPHVHHPSSRPRERRARAERCSFSPPERCDVPFVVFRSLAWNSNLMCAENSLWEVEAVFVEVALRKRLRYRVMDSSSRWIVYM